MIYLSLQLVVMAVAFVVMRFNLISLANLRLSDYTILPFLWDIFMYMAFGSWVQMTGCH